MVPSGTITVAVRVRPPSSWEAARLPDPCYDTTIRGDGALSAPTQSTPVQNSTFLRDIVQVIDDRVLTFDPEEKDRVRSFVERGFMPPGTKRYKDRRFIFDKVFNHESRQQDVYDGTAQPLLKGLFDGYNATVFAYGATGCGKTHTISGTEGDPGLIYLTMSDLFQRIEDRREEYTVEVMVTFLEIYNEEIRDLLAEPSERATPRGGLSIREDKAVKVVGLTELRPTSAEEVKEIVLLGNTRRTQSPTHANATSSRSHAVLQVHVTQSPRTANVTEERTVATLSIIDLAGSERAAATMNMGKRMVEGANINKSLLALGNCINALCESGGAVRHVPYRNSKLTRLLKFSLGGNCKTVMIVCVAPTSNHFDDTHNTLIYAERASKIKTKVVTRNVLNVDRHVGQYVEAINRLNHEDAEVTKRKKLDAAKEVERAQKDMDAKMNQTRASMVDGASCASRMAVANIRVTAARSRLAEIASSPSLTPDLEAERALLESFIAADEAALKSDSPLKIRAQRAANSRAMFEATMRAVSERSIELVKLDAKWRRAEIEKLKAEEERDVLKDAVEGMASVMVGLLGMLGRSTTVVGDSAAVLNNGINQDGAEHVQQVANMLSTIRQKNDQAFLDLVGRSTADYSIGETSIDLDRYDISTLRVPAKTVSAPRARTTRRSSVLNANASTSGTPIRSPRRSTRTSLASQPYRRVSDKEKKAAKGKNVQWRDEADTSSISSSSVSPQKASTAAGSESEWEDENEKTDDSVDLFSRSLPPSARAPQALEPTRRSTSLTIPNPRRPRASHLNPSFLKSRGGNSTLGSLGCSPRPKKPSKGSGSGGPLHRGGSRRRSVGIEKGARLRRRSSQIPEPMQITASPMKRALNRAGPSLDSPVMWMGMQILRPVEGSTGLALFGPDIPIPAIAGGSFRKISFVNPFNLEKCKSPNQRSARKARANPFDANFDDFA
ncbi:P-loop containing nucleoside triphosphate hydrolase protein [Flagelloscypha sp. PMI_526]|nr:P-loop containing nucleoside triphosphate hydrolase protein [Flagelloscypha sp. PMI_526]